MAEISSIAQRLLQFSPDAMVVVDEQGIIQLATETCHELFGLAPEQLVGQPIKRLIPERFHTRHGAHQRLVRAAGRWHGIPRGDTAVAVPRR